MRRGAHAVENGVGSVSVNVKGEGTQSATTGYYAKASISLTNSAFDWTATNSNGITLSATNTFTFPSVGFDATYNVTFSITIIDLNWSPFNPPQHVFIKVGTPTLQYLGYTSVSSNPYNGDLVSTPDTFVVPAGTAYDTFFIYVDYDGGVTSFGSSGTMTIESATDVLFKPTA